MSPKLKCHQNCITKTSEIGPDCLGLVFVEKYWRALFFAHNLLWINSILFKQIFRSFFKIGDTALCSMLYHFVPFWTILDCIEPFWGKMEHCYFYDHFGEASRFRLCYRWGLPHLVFLQNNQHEHLTENFLVT